MKRFLIALLVLLLLLSAFACKTGAKEPEATAEPTEAPAPAPTEEPVQAVLERHGWTADAFGSGAPDPAQGADGDAYVDVTDRTYYVRTDGAWTLLTSLDDAGLCLARFVDPSGTELTPQIVKTGACIAEPAIDTQGRTKEGWFSGGYAAAWAFDEPVNRHMTLRAICTDTMEKTAPLYTERDRSEYALRSDEPNVIAVFFIGFTDGLPLDKARFEDRFIGEYGLNECIRSAASYFRCNSYGRADLSFRFFYYDTGMTSKEGYDAVQKQYNSFFYRVVDRFRNEQPDAIRACDADGDGHIDLSVIVCGENPNKTVGDGSAYYLYGGSQGVTQFAPDTDVPTVNSYLKLPFDRLYMETVPEVQSAGTRVLLHEIGHTFGLMDYYDSSSLYGDGIDSLGGFDMQSDDFGDWNPYSKYTVGWLDPYVITEDIERITLKLGCSSETPDAILIPTSTGFNGTPFDEYILIDVMAPVGANAFDWNCLMDRRLVSSADARANGGVRVFHVDARLVDADGSGSVVKCAPIDGADLISFLRGEEPERWKQHSLWFRYVNSNGFEPYLEGDSNWRHHIDLIPSDGSGKFRLSTPLDWAIYTPACVKDLFGPGDVFSMETCADAFPDAPYMNDGGTLDYRVTVEHYDKTAHEAIVTVERLVP